MTRRTSQTVVAVMAAFGWILASVFAVLACMLGIESQHHDVAWQILGALALGFMLAVIPVGATLFAAYHAFNNTTSPSQSIANDQATGIRWRWTVFAILCGLEMLVFPLTLIAAAADDDSLILSIPFNLAIVLAALLAACLHHRRRAFIVLGAIHLFGMTAATFAAAIDIESVVASGGLLLVNAVALAIIGTRPRTIGNIFSLSTVLFIVISFLVIAIGEFGPNQAESPLYAAIVAYQLLFAPVGVWAVYRESSEQELPRRLRFGLRQMLGAMAVICIASGLARLAYMLGDELRVAIAVGMGTLIVAATVLAAAAPEWIRLPRESLGLRKTPAG